ncbi:MAG TPA: sugar phosphate nucleotidyltransferase [Aquihabitans sp.]|nr:sugar phosphate nucleotidyltransferase [Aquihabitans sp.]
MAPIDRVWGNEGFHQRVKRMGDSLAGVVLAAGAGRRLAPLTWLRPKPLCPVGTRPLVDLALERLAPHTDALAVNLHHGAALLDAHLPAAVIRSVEEPVALGTAGALGALRGWIAGRPVLVTNGDTWFPSPLDLSSFVDGWDGERIRLLCVRDARRGDFGDLRYCGVALLPWADVEPLEAEPSGLYEVSWRAAAAAGRLDLHVHDGPFVDCGTPADYLRANLLASGGRPVVDPAAHVGAGARLERCVVWDASSVAPGEVLVDAVRAGPRTVLIRGDLGPMEG